MMEVIHTSDSHTVCELAFWFPKVMLPPPPHPFTSPNLTVSCDSGSLHSSPHCSGQNIPVGSHVVLEAGPRSSRCVCLPLSDQFWFTAQQMPNFLTVCQSCIFIAQTKQAMTNNQMPAFAEISGTDSETVTCDLGLKKKKKGLFVQRLMSKHTHQTSRDKLWQ